MRVLLKLAAVAAFANMPSAGRAVVYVFAGTADVPGFSHSEQCYPPTPEKPSGHCDPVASGPIIEHVLGFATFDSDNPGSIATWTSPPFSQVEGSEYLGITSVGFDDWGNYLLQGVVTGHLDVPHFCPALNCLHTVSTWSGPIELRQVEPQPVPEADSWAMMIFGLFGAGLALRSGRRERGWVRSWASENAKSLNGVFE